MLTQGPRTQEPHLLRPLADEHGLRIDAITAPFLLATRRVWGAEPTGKIYRAVHLAEEVGAPLVVIHPPYVWQVRFRRWAQENLAEFSERTEIGRASCRERVWIEEGEEATKKKTTAAR